ncbi:hypothetical protein ACI2KR_07535 [Pseudomonas luteola]
MNIKALVTHIFKENIERFPQQMGTDPTKTAQAIMSWISELSAKGVDEAELREIKEILDADTRFANKPAELSDFLSVKKLLDSVKDLAIDENSLKMVQECQKLHRQFEHRYGARWKTKTLEESTERIILWIKELLLFNVDPSTISKAFDWTCTKSDFNRFAPTSQDFILACKMTGLGDDVPSPQEAYLMVSGLTKRKTHQLVEHTLPMIKSYEARNGKTITKELFVSIYQDLLFDYAALGYIPERSNPEVKIERSNDDNEIVDKESLLKLIDNFLDNNGESNE